MAKKKKKTATDAQEQSPWRRCTVDVIDMAAEAVTAVLTDLDACGMEIDDDETRAIPGKDYTPTGRSRITATFSRRDELELDVAKAITRVSEVFDLGDLHLEWEDLFAEDWNAAFKEQWEPVQIGKRIWIVPSWRDVELNNEEIEIRMDPGMAFGTGTHETTQLCATALEQMYDNPVGGTPKNILDVGTGSGILSLVALKLGAHFARGTDIDPVCVRVSHENAVDNGLADKFIASEDDADTWGGVFDVVIANILAPVLIELSAKIARAVPSQGKLMLSGVLKEQTDAVVDAYVARGLVKQHVEELNGWVRIDMMRP